MAGGAEMIRGGDAGAGRGGALATAAGDAVVQASCGASKPALDRL